MIAKLSPSVQKKLSELYKRDKELLEKIQKRIEMFETNARHPSLRIHKLSGKMSDVWSLSISKNFRMLYILEGEEAYFFDLGTHDQVYRQ